MSEPCTCHYGGDFDGEPHLHASVSIEVTEELLRNLNPGNTEASFMEWLADTESPTP